MSETQATVRSISAELIAGTMSVDEAATALQGITGTSTMGVFEDGGNAYENMLQDPEMGDDNDVYYIESACGIRKIPYDEMSRLIDVITPLK